VPNVFAAVSGEFGGVDIGAVDADAFDAFEAAGWEQRAEGYASVFVPITAHVVEPLLDAAKVGSGQRVLDVASGPGHVAAACAARGAVPIGLDVAHQMVEVARGRYPGLDFRQGDGQHLPFEDGSMDAVVGNFAILHFGRPERAAAEFVRVLAPGGSVALSTWDSPHRARQIGVFLDAASEAGVAPLPDLPAGPPFFRFADDAEFARLLHDAGLSNVAVRTVRFTYHVGSADELWDGMRRATVRTQALIFKQPQDVQARIRAIYNRIIQEYAVAGGGLDIPISVKVAAGT
jgi:ubiquinone/menaquinone biosynthesis C-methylase UbiE